MDIVKRLSSDMTEMDGKHAHTARTGISRINPANQIARSFLFDCVRELRAPSSHQNKKRAHKIISIDSTIPLFFLSVLSSLFQHETNRWSKTDMNNCFTKEIQLPRLRFHILLYSSKARNKRNVTPPPCQPSCILSSLKIIRLRSIRSTTNLKNLPQHVGFPNRWTHFPTANLLPSFPRRAKQMVDMR
jgi:hypothetical protein